MDRSQSAAVATLQESGEVLSAQGAPRRVSHVLLAGRLSLAVVRQAQHWRDGYAEQLDDRLCISRDGVRFSRLGGRRSFLPLGLSGTFASKWTWSLPNPIRMGSELWIYYFGDNQDHDGFIDPAVSQRRMAIDRAILRLDGFVSADAAYTGGELVTPLLTFAGSNLELNVDPGAGGSIRVELLDASDQPIQGFNREEATALYENHVCLLADGARGLQRLGGADQTGLRVGPHSLLEMRLGDQEHRLHRAPPDRGD